MPEEPRIELGLLRPGDVLSGPSLGCGIGGQIVVAAQQQQGACTLCLKIAPDPAGVPRVERLYILHSARRVPTDAVARGHPVNILELVMAAERALNSKLARVENSWHKSWDYLQMLDFTGPGNGARFVDFDIARRHLAVVSLQLKHAARVVQRNWRRAVTDPAMRMCRNRLLSEFRELESEQKYSK